VQQEILAKNPSSNLRVYAVWFNMLPHDSRGGRPVDILADPRVVQFWDDSHLAGAAFAPLAGWQHGVLWDAYFLYGPEARWAESTSSPPIALSVGRTIFSTREKLKVDFEKAAAGGR
jgi:hypothetical protein